MKKLNLSFKNLNIPKLPKAESIFKQLPEIKEVQVFNYKIQLTNKVKGVIALATATPSLPIILKLTKIMYFQQTALQL